MPLRNEQLVIARERIARVLQFLAESERRRSTPKRTIAEYPWALTFSSLPQSPAIQRGRIAPPTDTEDDEAGDDFVLRVRRPKETPCPAPPAILREWLVDGWQAVGGNVATIAERNVGITRDADGNDRPQIVQFGDLEERVRALTEWTARRLQWENAERPVRQAIDVFNKLFDLWGRIERDSEKLEILACDGILSWRSPAGRVDHPLLLQRLSLEFDAKTPEFLLRDADTSPQLAHSLLHTLDGVDPQRVGNGIDTLARDPVHPLGAEDTVGFLKYLVQSLWNNGEVVEPGARRDETRPQVRRDPVILLGSREEGFVRAIEELRRKLPDVEDLPAALVRVVGIMDDGGADANGNGAQGGAGIRDSEVDLLFTKPSNAEQERIAQRLHAAGCVLVQGPPGTGKTHTIANLVGHLLAQGKSILVTSHTSKALRVLRDAIVPEIRPLCVSVLDNDADSRQQLEAAVSGIAGKLSTVDTAGLVVEVDQLRRHRESIKQRLAEVEQQFFHARRAEYEDIVVAGVGTPPSEAARRVAAGRVANDWIPGPLAEGAPMPLSVAEVRELYDLNRLVPVEDERDLVGFLPPVETLPAEIEFAGLVEELRNLDDARHSEFNVYWLHDQQDAANLDLLSTAAADAVRPLAEPQAWLRECIAAGKRGGPHVEPWKKLVELIERTQHELAGLRETILSADPRSSSTLPVADQVALCAEIVERLEAGGGIGFFWLAFKKEHKSFIETASVGGRRPATLADFRALHAGLTERSLRETLASRWNRQMVPLGADRADSFRGRVEDVAAQYAPRIRDCIAWYRNTWSAVEGQCAALGLQLEQLIQRIPPNAEPQGELLRLRDAVAGPLQDAVRDRKRLLRLRELEQSRAMMLEALPILDVASDPSGVVRAMREAVVAGDVATYSSAWRRIQELIRQKAPVARRQQLLRTLEPSAPGWADAVRARRPRHDAFEPSGDPVAAWNQRQWSQALAKRAAIDFGQLQQDIARLKDDLHTMTAKLVDALTWCAQSRRTSGEQQQQLIGWLDIVRRTGAGTGKRAAKLRAAAREKLAGCKDAVPVWIMPMSRVAESYDPRNDPYDVVIIDEASQSSVLGLLAFAVAREVVVVGDHQQVSPDAVGQTIEHAEQLIATYLAEIPNRDLYDGKTSVYDLARQSFGAIIRLVEHFRCVPEIIQFSNNLCYEGEIKPLRESSSVPHRPFTVAHRVANGVSLNKRNQAEATEIASLVVAACEMPEYDGSEFGVISLVGDEQAMLIDKLLHERLGTVEHQRRRILVGNAAQFQGDERDVMFLSVVDSPRDGGPHAMRRDDRFRQRFNVAASRARNQMWVVHSLNPATDLQAGDLRHRLIRHAENPMELTQLIETAQARAESPFEQQVIRQLMTEGYRVKPQWPVGAYRIDIVVIGERGMVAVECDGDRFHPPEALERDMARQAVLERLGWRFIRIRGSEYYLDPERCIAGVIERLTSLDVAPCGVETEATAPAVVDELYQRVVRRAAELRVEWNGRLRADDEAQVELPLE